MVNVDYSFPSDWETKTLYELSDGGFQNGLFYEVDRKDKGIPIINVGNLYGDVPIENRELALFDATSEEIEAFGVNSGDIFFTRSSIVPSGIAMCNAYLSTNDISVVFDSHVIRFSVDKKQVNPVFLTLQCRMPYSREHLVGRAKTATMTTIDQKGIGSCPIHMPKLIEQEKIVKVLMSFNSYIANLTELIEKKKAIRDGALEDLMSGRTRLAGFGDAWITVPFSEYFTLLKNNTYARDLLSEHGTIGNIHYGDILVKYGNVVTDNDEIPRLKDRVPFSEKWLLQKNDILIADTAEDDTVGKAIQIGPISFPAVGGLHTIVCRPNWETAPSFLGYYINSKVFHDQLLPHITGIKVSSISKKAIRTTEVQIPSDIKEQKAIADVLTVMDNEIKDLEDERGKMFQIREGTMDDLLTGRVRLTV